MKTIAEFLIMSVLTSFLTACSGAKPEGFASDAPIKKIVFAAPFPADLLYQSSPDAKVIVGKKKIEPAIYEVGGFDVETGKRLWQLPFVGKVVGQTETQILVYEEKTAVLHFINPKTGEITRKIAPAPNPLMSRNGLELGMAFTDDVYLTTKALYTSIWQKIGDENAPAGDTTDEGNYREDESFKIGVTAKTWAGDNTKWFLPPVKQIVTIESRPVIFGDRVFIINPPQTVDGEQTYQIVSLTDGAEIRRGASEGHFYYLNDKFFIEQTKSFARRIEPLTGKELWRIEYNAKYSQVSEIGNQISVAANQDTSKRTIRIVDAETGKLLKQFDMSLDLQDTPLQNCFLTKDNQILLNFAANPLVDIQKRDFDYWAAYDAETSKILWRTNFQSHSVSSLIPFASDKLRVE